MSTQPNNRGAYGFQKVILSGHIGTISPLRMITLATGDQIECLSFRLLVNQNLPGGRKTVDATNVELYRARAVGLAPVLKVGMHLTVIGQITYQAYRRTNNENGAEELVGTARMFRVDDIALDAKPAELTPEDIAAYINEHREVIGQVLELAAAKAETPQSVETEPTEQKPEPVPEEPVPVGVFDNGVTDEDVPF